SSLNELGKGDIKINILHAEAGNISESDIMLATASHAIVVGFNVQADAEFRRNAKVRLRREGTIIFEGEFSSLKHEKEDVREVRNGFECGAGFRNYNDFAVGDQIECYVLEKATA
ncbi:MAG TPA: hypothetical protein DCZ08_10490, partial [Anaerolineaceae bacterium]|nr:hypothetical protein [Anaerolineaceae bacterium]